MSNAHSCTYLVCIEVSSPNHIELEADLVQLAAKHGQMRYTWGPREVLITPKVVALAVKTYVKD
jgi:hypothetical protein